MLIAMDVGNSHIKLGGFNGDDLQFVASIATDDRQTGEQYACMLQQIFALYGAAVSQIDAVVLCSVVPSMPPILLRAIALLSSCPVLRLTSGTKTGLNIKLEQPRTLGSDFVANAVWAVQNGHTPCVVVDVGTATTFTAIDAQGALIGTAIAAGVGIMLDGLKKHAAQLPTVQLESPTHGAAGKNTAQAICSGVVYGTAALIDGMLARFTQELGCMPRVWLTGGAAEVIAPFLHTQTVYDAHITLRGLALVWKKNRG